MLVYVNSLALQPSAGSEAVIKQIAAWVGKSNKAFVDPILLAQGIRELKLQGSNTLSSVATSTKEGDKIYPYFFCAKYQHADFSVRGRRWTAEIGISHKSSEDKINLSVLLKTDEISARVTDLVQVTRPLIVSNILSGIDAADEIPSKVINLTEENSSGFIYDIERKSREHPIVVLSCNDDGVFPLNSKRLQSVLVGLAQVVEIPSCENTHAIEREVTRKYTAFGGSINIIFPYRSLDSGRICRTTLLKPFEINQIKEQGTLLESEILSIITHYSNIPNSWKHISTEKVRQEILHQKIATGEIHQSSADEIINDFAQYEKENSENNLSMKADIEDKKSKIEELEFEIEGLKQSFERFKKGNSSDQKNNDDDFNEKVVSALTGNISLADALSIINTTKSDRIIILDSAFTSSKESDRGGFFHGSKALELMLRLSGEYWDILSSGKGNSNAKKVFGKSEFAAKESESLTTSGKARRTFYYYDEKILMEKHLKLGIKDSRAETLRIHFEWKSDDRKIIIGHCGKHLDF